MKDYLTITAAVLTALWLEAIMAAGVLTIRERAIRKRKMNAFEAEIHRLVSERHEDEEDEQG